MSANEELVAERERVDAEMRELAVLVESTKAEVGRARAREDQAASRLVDLHDRGANPDEILAYHRHLANRYFFDEVHLTDAGHRIVSEQLFQYLVRKGMVGAP